MDDKQLFAKLAEDSSSLTPDQLLKEDEILTDKDKQRPEPAKVIVDAKEKAKKACANCTCGLADELEQEAKDKAKAARQEAAANADSTDPAKAKSSCGSCYLGDAFRCASCPYRGMPAFKPGEKVTIETESDDI